MTRLPRMLAVSACAAISIVAAAACDTSGGSRPKITGGLVSSPSATFAVSVAPTTMPLVPASRFICPLSQPFTTNFDLIIVPERDVIVDGLTLAFIDGFGQRSTTLFTGTRLTSLLGSTTLLGGVRRTILLQPQFGCGIAIPQTINVLLGMVDAVGVRFDATATASFR